METNNKIPNTIYFFNDVIEELYDYENVIDVNPFIRAYNQMTNLFISNEVIQLDYFEAIENLKSILSTDRFYDWVILIGYKGARLFNYINRHVKFNRVEIFNINRIFFSNLSYGFECDYIYSTAKNININSTANVLIVDDILYTGNTLRKVMEVLRIDPHKADVASLISFKDSINLFSQVYSGYSIDNFTWPIENVELWCFRDFIEEYSLRMKDNINVSFIDDELFCTKQIFGNNYGKAKDIIYEIRNVIKNHSVVELCKAFDLDHPYNCL